MMDILFSIVKIGCCIFVSYILLGVAIRIIAKILIITLIEAEIRGIENGTSYSEGKKRSIEE